MIHCVRKKTFEWQVERVGNGKMKNGEEFQIMRIFNSSFCIFCIFVFTSSMGKLIIRVKKNCDNLTMLTVVTAKTSESVIFLESTWKLKVTFSNKKYHRHMTCRLPMSELNEKCRSCYVSRWGRLEEWKVSVIHECKKVEDEISLIVKSKFSHFHVWWILMS